MPVQKVSGWDLLVNADTEVVTEIPVLAYDLLRAWPSER